MIGADGTKGEDKEESYTVIVMEEEFTFHRDDLLYTLLWPLHCDIQCLR